VQDKHATVTRPVKELKGFRKIMLKKGETKEVAFTLTTADLSFYHQDLRKYYEPGVFIVYVGTNSEQAGSAMVNLK
jgi:beta-glucosidase